MKRETKEMYGTTIHIVSYTAADIAKGTGIKESEEGMLYGDILIEKTGAVEGVLMRSAEDVNGRERTMGIKCGQGIIRDEDGAVAEFFVVIADGVNDKQMHNILLSLETEQRVLLTGEFTAVKVMEESVQELAEVEAPAEKKAPRKRTKKTEQ